MVILFFQITQYDALEDADAMVLITERKPVLIPDFTAMSKLMKQTVVLDGRNQYEPSVVKAAGFECRGIGRVS